MRQPLPSVASDLQIDACCQVPIVPLRHVLAITTGDTMSAEARRALPADNLARMTSQKWVPRCAVCREPSIEELPMVRPTLDDAPRPNVPLCVEHRRMFVAGVLRLGYCPVGRHYSHHMDHCGEHDQLMTAP
jgi:hypothetical protein